MKLLTITLPLQFVVSGLSLQTLFEITDYLIYADTFFAQDLPVL